jgi:tetratricopeptide (TPR) repeat protein/TolB-like protein
MSEKTPPDPPTVESDTRSHEPLGEADSPAITRWGDLELLERVGGGAFADVYRARDPQLDRDVALKLLRPLAPHDRLADRALREGRMLARLRHPNVVTVYGADIRQDRVGLTMEFVRGSTLQELLRTRGPFSAAEAALVGKDLCRALAAVHGAGLVHRDVKANNVIREAGGRVVLMDFGLVHGRGDAGEWKGRLAGTPIYLAPEIFAGEEATSASDIYSLGVLLYHLVSDDYPIKARSADEYLSAHAEGRRKRLQDARPELPDAFVRMVERALHPDPSRRYGSAGEMGAALSRALGTEPESAATARVEPGPDPRPARRAWGGRGGIAMATVAVVALAATLLPVAFRSRPAGTADGAPVTALAVIPFKDAGGSERTVHLAQALTADVTRELQGFQVVVRGRQSAAELARLSPSDAAARLRVDAVVQGAVRETGGATSVSVELLRPGADEPFWRQTVSPPVQELSGVHRRIARAIAGAIGARPRPESSPARPAYSPDLRAYEAYHRGRVYWEQRTREGLLTSVEYFKEATRIDPAYAQPWAGLADAYLALGIPSFGAFRPQEARRLAQEAALKALDMDADLPEVHTSLAFAAFIYDWNWAAAEARFEKAIELNPQYALAHQWYADYLTDMGRHAEAMEQIRAALEHEPLSVIIRRDVAYHLFFQRDYAGAIDQLEAVLHLDPRYAAARSLLGRALVEQGRHAEGLAQLRQVAPDLPEPAALSFVAYAEAAAGQRGAARKTLDRLFALRSDAYVSPYYVALVYARLGEADEAVRWLEKGFQEQDTTMPTMRVDPRFDSLRGNARYNALVQRMNFPAR